MAPQAPVPTPQPQIRDLFITHLRVVYRSIERQILHLPMTPTSRLDPQSQTWTLAVRMVEPGIRTYIDGLFVYVY